MGSYNDSIYKIIELSDVIEACMELDSVRYLKKVKQLGFAFEIYHPGENSRFQHVVGTAYVAGLMARYARLSREDIRYLEAAGMLHDPHYPFSHPTETGLPVKHEVFMQRALREEKQFGRVDGREVCALLRKLGLDPVRIADILDGKDRLSPFISNHTLDADKLDYIPRDAHIAARSFVETQRIIKKVRSKDGEVGIDVGAEPNVRELITGRTVNFEVMYGHRDVHAGETTHRYCLELDPRIRKNPQRMAERIHRMTEDELTYFLQESPDPFVSILAHRLARGSNHWLKPVYTIGGDASLPQLRILAANKQAIRAELLKQGMLVSFTHTDNAVKRAEEKPYFPVFEGERKRNLFDEQSALGAYRQVHPRAFAVYGSTGEEGEKARAMLEKYVKAA